MKILMSSSGGVIRGIENWPEYGLARELVKMGNDVTVISSTSAMRHHDCERYEIIDGITVRRFNPVVPSSFFFALRNDFSLLHMHHLGYLAPISSYAALANRIRNKPSVLTVHGIYHDPYVVKDVENPFADGLNRNITRHLPTNPAKIFNWFSHVPLAAEKIVALTEWEKKELEKFGIERNKIHVIPNGIDLEKYSKRSKNYFKKRNIYGKILLFIGQPSKRKGWQYLLAAMPQILAEFPDAKAVFVGYRKNEELEKLAKILGIEKSVVFQGYLPEHEKISALMSADVFVLPTLYEGFGIVFLEAMAAGIPIVTTDVASNSEIVEHGKNGVLTKPGDKKSLAAAVIKILGNKRLANTISKNNLKKVGKYNWKNVAKQYTSVYESMMR